MTITDTWGRSVNGSWTGLTGFLQREEADVGSTGMFVLKERLPVVNFIAATTPTRYFYRSDTNTFQSLIFCTCRTKIIIELFMLSFRVNNCSGLNFWVDKLCILVGGYQQLSAACLFVRNHKVSRVFICQCRKNLQTAVSLNLSQWKNFLLIFHSIASGTRRTFWDCSPSETCISRWTEGISTNAFTSYPHEDTPCSCT
jgi:hypothetical protein